MRNNTLKKHLIFNDDNLELLNSKNGIDDWLSKIKISEKSYFNDSLWILDGSEAHKKHYLEIKWNDFLSTEDPKYTNLKNNVKKCIFYSQTTLCSQIPKKPLTQTTLTIYFKVLVKWMYDNSINKFSDLTPEHFKCYYEWVKNKEKHNGNKIKDKSYYIMPFKILYIYREYLDDFISFDVTEGTSIYSFAGYKREANVQTKAIPNIILEKIMHEIIPIVDFISENNHLTNEEIINSKIIPVKSLNTFYNVLNAIAYTVIGLYTGMRASEILSIKKHSTQIDNQTVIINSLLFKTTHTKKGKNETWACGLNNEENYALKIIHILEKFTPSSHKNLFFKYVNKNFNILDTSSINNHLQTMLNTFNIDWDISTHQFRRTFAKLIGTTDKTNLLALQQHFKHVSVSMTSYYVGNEVELLEMINEEKQLEIASGLDTIFNSPHLAGKLGEKIAKSNLQFRGKAGEQLRKDYIENLINNSDLIVMPHEYGFCIYQPEQARCQGKQENIGLNTCVKCSNFVVSSNNKVFWMNRINEYEKFSNHIKELTNQEMTIKELNYNIDEAKNIINKINKE